MVEKHNTLVTINNGWWRQAERGRDHWTGEPWGRQRPDCAGRGLQRRGEATGQGKADTGLYEEFLGQPSREESVDERWRPAGGVPSRRTVTPRLGEMGRKKRVQREREETSTGER